MSTATHTGMIFGYARISTTQQDEALQRDALVAACVDRIHADQNSASTASRPAFDEMLGQLRAGDTVVDFDEAFFAGGGLTLLADLVDRRGSRVKAYIPAGVCTRLRSSWARADREGVDAPGAPKWATIRQEDSHEASASAGLPPKLPLVGPLRPPKVGFVFGGDLAAGPGQGSGVTGHESLAQCGLGLGPGVVGARAAGPVLVVTLHPVPTRRGDLGDATLAVDAAVASRSSCHGVSVATDGEIRRHL